MSVKSGVLVFSLSSFILVQSLKAEECITMIKGLYSKSAPISLVRPRPILAGARIGVFTPSTPAPATFQEKYAHGLRELERRGYAIKEGFLSYERKTQGYRAANPKDRAREFMDLIRDPEVDVMMSSLGGSNSSSLIPYLDFDEIRLSRKPIVGYSDVTSLHLAVLVHSGLSTFYGPAVMPSFGEYPSALDETVISFEEAIGVRKRESSILVPPARWSNHFRNAMTDEWKALPREFHENDGWHVLSEGLIEAPIIVANLATLLTAAGTDYFPDLSGKILLVEEMDAPYSKEERNFRQLERMGIFDQISGLIVGKPESLKTEGASFSYDELIQEIVGPRDYPIITNFDVGHTHPMITLGEMTLISIEAEFGKNPKIEILSEAFD